MQKVVFKPSGKSEYTSLHEPWRPEECHPGPAIPPGDIARPLEAEIKGGLDGFALPYHGMVTVTDRRPGEGYRICIDARTHNGSAQAEILLRFDPEDGGKDRVTHEAEIAFVGAQKLQHRPSPGGWWTSSHMA